MRETRQEKRIPVTNVDTGLDDNAFFKTMIRSISGTLEDSIGLQEASGFISLVGQDMGKKIKLGYVRTLGESGYQSEEIHHILTDLKERIGGTFKVHTIDEDRIVLTNGRCPFGDDVINRTSLCMMTSNVFGYLTADKNGYAAIRLDNTIAQGHGFCKVTIDLKMTEETNNSGEFREYFAS